MRRIGLLGPWDPNDVVDRLLIGHVAEVATRELEAEVVLVAGRGHERLPWPVQAVCVDELLTGELSGLVISGDLAIGDETVGVPPPDVWMVANSLAVAAGLPVAWHGVRLLGSPTSPGAAPVETIRMLAGCTMKPLVVDAATARLVGAGSRQIAHPATAMPHREMRGDRGGRVLHASPAVLAALGDSGAADGQRWLALRPGRGDRLVGLPPEVERCWWTNPDEVIEAFARATEVVTDDPAVGLLATTQGAQWCSPTLDPVSPEEPEIGHQSAWRHLVAELERDPSPDAAPLRIMLRGLAAKSCADGSAEASRSEVRPKPPVELSEARRAVRETVARADDWREKYYRLQGRRSVRIALRIATLMSRVRRAGPAGLVRSLVRRAWRPLETIGHGSAWTMSRVRKGSLDGKIRLRRSVPTSAPADHHAVARVLASVASSDRTSGPLVSVLVLTRNGLPHLRRLLPALEATRYRSFEVVIVDNGSDEPTRSLLASWRSDVDVRILRNERNVSFGDGNDQAAEVAKGDLVLLLNDDVEPMDPGWMGHLVTTAEETAAGAVGARLVYPLDAPMDNAGDSASPPLSLQHRGIHFENRGDGVPRARHLDARADATTPEACEVRAVPAATAACLLVNRAVYDEVGGFTTGYDYGLEDVDLCLKIRAAGHHVVVDGAIALWHHEFGTQNARGAEDKKRRREHNRQRFADQWGPRLHREVLRDRLLASRQWSETPLHVAITVSRLDERRRHGDWYSAHELGSALTSLGWHVSYVERYEDRWYDLSSDVDVLVVLIDTFDLARVPDHLVTVAWVRNWTERWVSRPWFDDFDVVFTSSEASTTIVQRGSTHQPVLLPLATDPGRFRPQAANADERCDVVFVGSYWGEERPVARVLADLAETHEVRLYGRGWDQVPEVAHLHQGVVAYSRLPSVLASARVVLDDTASPTKPYEAVNTRVFDALASGSLVVSDNPRGIAQRFLTELPTWEEPHQAVALVEEWLADDPGRDELVARARQEVMTHHTYELRARRFRDALLDWVDSPRVDVLTGVPDRRVEHRWGDTHYARGFQRELRRAGVATRLVRLPEWTSLGAATADAVVHLFGRSYYTPRPAQSSLLWIISHPESVTTEVCDTYNVVLVASDRFAAQLREEVSVPVHVVHQATDPDRFRPEPNGPPHDLLFIGNSRNVRRRVITDLLPTDLDLAIYGWGWTADLVDLAFVRSEHVPNAQVGGYYASSAILLNDHWDDMREHAFVSNRLYDALAAGAFVISDEVEGIDELFNGGVVTYRDPGDLHALIEHYLAAPWERERIAARGRDAVLGRHTFAHRVADVLAILGQRESNATISGSPLHWPRGSVTK